MNLALTRKVNNQEYYLEEIYPGPPEYTGTKIVWVTDIDDAFLMNQERLNETIERFSLHGCYSTICPNM